MSTSTAIAAANVHSRNVVTQMDNVIQHLEAAAQSCRNVVGQHPKATPGTVRGLVAEFHHEATFNINAIKAGAPQR